MHERLDGERARGHRQRHDCEVELIRGDGGGHLPRVAGDDDELDRGVPRAEPPQHGRKQIDARGRAGAQAKASADRPVERLERLARGLELRERARRVLEENLARARRRRALAHALEERHAHLLLELPDVEAHGRLAQMEILGGAGEAAAPHDLLQGADMRGIQVEGTPASWTESIARGFAAAAAPGTVTGDAAPRLLVAARARRHRVPRGALRVAGQDHDPGRVVLPDQEHEGRGAALVVQPLLRLRRGRLDVLRAALGPERGALGEAHAAGVPVQHQGVCAPDRAITSTRRGCPSRSPRCCPRPPGPTRAAASRTPCSPRGAPVGVRHVPRGAATARRRGQARLRPVPDGAVVPPWP